MTSYRKELTKHIPDLWKYSLVLRPDQDGAHNLLCNTIDQALHKEWKKPKETPLYTWLTRLMYEQHLRGIAHGQIRPLQMPVMPESLKCQDPISVH